jgi:hypothetical protein
MPKVLKGPFRRSVLLARMTEIDAPASLLDASAKVASPQEQRPLSLGSGAFLGHWRTAPGPSGRHGLGAMRGHSGDRK